MRNYRIIFPVLFLALFLTGCTQEVTFRGKVYSGQMNPDTDLVEIIGPIANATVKERRSPEVVMSDAEGNYLLKISVPAVIGFQNPKLYTIESSGSTTTARGSSAAVDIYARAGETVFVRDMVLHSIAPNPDIPADMAPGGN